VGFVEVSHISIPRSRRGPVSSIFGTSYVRAHSIWETTTKFCMVIKLGARKFFYRVHHECWRSICLRYIKPSCFCCCQYYILYSSLQFVYF